jgi:hypothetical protein
MLSPTTQKINIFSMGRQHDRLPARNTFLQKGTQADTRSERLRMAG